MPWAKIQDLTRAGMRLTETEEHVTGLGLRAARLRVFPIGTVLLAMYGSIGTTSIVAVPTTTNQAILGIQCGADLDPEYLWSYLTMMQPRLASTGRGGTQSNVNATMIRDMLIPAMPVPEQRRIAARLSKQLAAASRASNLLGERMTAVGMLGRRALDDTIGKAISAGPPSRPIRDALRPRNEITHPRDGPTGDAMFVGLEHIESDTGHRIGGLTIRLEDLTGRKARFHAGDIVYGYLRPYLNKVWLADSSGFCSVDQYVFKVDPSVADAEYVAHFMRSSHYLSNAPIKSTPGQLPRIRTEEVLEVPVPLPGLVEQRQIAAELGRRLATIDAMNASIRAEQEAIEALTAALLRRAFEHLAA